MSRLSYIWMVVWIALAFGVTSCESRKRDAAIRADSERILSTVVRGGCAQNNHMRDLYLRVAGEIHPESIQKLRRDVHYEDSVRRVIDEYRRMSA